MGEGAIKGASDELGDEIVNMRAGNGEENLFGTTGSASEVEAEGGGGGTLRREGIVETVEMKRFYLLLRKPL